MEIQNLVLFALKTAHQALTRQESSIIHALRVLAEPSTHHGISTNVNHGRAAPAASTSLRTAQAALTEYVVAAGLGNFPHLPTPIPVRIGQIA